MLGGDNNSFIQQWREVLWLRAYSGNRVRISRATLVRLRHMGN